MSLTSGSNRSLRSLGRAKARPLTKRYVKNMRSYEDTKNAINSLFDDCQSERGFSPGQSLCFIEEEYFPWNTSDTTWQLCFYVLLKTALERGIDKLSWDLNYIGHKARELLNNELFLDKARTKLTKYESECLASDIYLIKINFL